MSSGSRPQHDAFDDVRMEYAQMLKNQLAKGNNGLVRTKYITFGIEAENIREAKPRLERIETDILNNFKVLGVSGVSPEWPWSGCRSCMRHSIRMIKVPFQISSLIRCYAPDRAEYKGLISHRPAFVFKNGKDFHDGKYHRERCPICRFWHRSLRTGCLQNFWIWIRT